MTLLGAMMMNAIMEIFSTEGYGEEESDSKKR